MTAVSLIFWVADCGTEALVLFLQDTAAVEINVLLLLKVIFVLIFWIANNHYSFLRGNQNSFHDKTLSSHDVFCIEISHLWKWLVWQSLNLVKYIQRWRYQCWVIKSFQTQHSRSRSLVFKHSILLTSWNSLHSLRVRALVPLCLISSSCKFFMFCSFGGNISIFFYFSELIISFNYNVRVICVCVDFIFEEKKLLVGCSESESNSKFNAIKNN